jgi:hypothetical protein
MCFSVVDESRRRCALETRHTTVDPPFAGISQTSVVSLLTLVTMCFGMQFFAGLMYAIDRLEALSNWPSSTSLLPVNSPPRFGVL